MARHDPERPACADAKKHSDPQSRALRVAVKLHRESLNRLPNNALLWIQLGDALDALGENGDARVAYVRAYQLQPSVLELWTGSAPQVHPVSFGYLSRLVTIGLGLNDCSYYEQALAVFDHLVSLDPECAFFWTLKGMVLGNMHRCEEALAIANQAIDLDPEDIGAWATKVKALALLGRAEEAREAQRYEDAARRASGVPEWMPCDGGDDT